MPNLDTYEIQLDTVGQEAVQQTLDALGVKATAINTAAAGASGADGSAAAFSPFVPPGSADPSRAEPPPPAIVDLSRVESLLERIAAAVERNPLPPYQPVY